MIFTNALAEDEKNKLVRLTHKGVKERNYSLNIFNLILEFVLLGHPFLHNV